MKFDKITFNARMLSLLLYVLFYFNIVFSMEINDFIVYPEQGNKSYEEICAKDFHIGDEGFHIKDVIQFQEGSIQEAFFTPNDDVCGILTALIDNETKSIRVAAFFLTEEKIVAALVRAKHRGVTVKVVAGSFVVLGKYDAGAEELERQGVQVYAYDPPKRSCRWARGIMHNKFFVFEENMSRKSLVVTGSLNLTYSAHMLNKENICITDDLQMVSDYRERFDYLQNQCCYKYQRLESLVPVINDEVCEALFSPDDDMFRVLVQLIHKEQASIKMAAFFLTESDIVDALTDAVARGVSVELVVSSNVVSGKYDRAAKSLFAKGAKIFAYKLNEPDEGIMHNKFVVFGNNIHRRALLWTGSANFTASARSFNKENACIFDNSFMLEEYNKQFDYLKENLCYEYKYIPQRRGRRAKTQIQAVVPQPRKRKTNIGTNEYEPPQKRRKMNI